MRRLLSRLAIATGLGLVISVTVLAPTAASAAPSDCFAETAVLHADGWCYSGTGEYRTVVVCEHLRTTGGVHYHYLREEFGPWVTVPAISRANCRPELGAVYTYQAYLKFR